MKMAGAARKVRQWAALGSVVSAMFGAALAGCSKDGSGSSGGQGGSPEAGAASEGGGTNSGGATSTGGAANGGRDSTSDGQSSGGASGSSGRSSGGASGSSGRSSGGASGSSGRSSGGASGGSGRSSGGASGGGGRSSGGAASGSGGATHSGPWKVMMLGDSITAATCYPQLVSKGLITANHKNFQFIGTETNQQSCNATQVQEEGHGGYGVTYLPQNSTRGACQGKPACGSYAELQTWAAENPDIVLMHYGTNDVWDGQSPSNILSAYVSVIAEFRKKNPNVVFFVSKIIKLNPAGCTNCLSNVAALAAALTDSWATTNSTATSPIWLVDNYGSSFDPNDKADTGDGVHPTAAGAQKSADVTVAALITKNYF
jgi:lysophospholipase L1-like esterase